MEQLKQAIATIKNRWEEVTLIFGLFLMGSFALAWISPDVFEGLKEIRAGREPQIGDHVMLLMVFSIVVSLISMVLYLGFVSTVHGAQGGPQSAQVLFQTGKKFFWRILACMILFIVVLSFLMTVVSAALANMKLDENLYTAITIFLMLILIKPTIMIPALIIVLDCRIFQSLGYLRDVKLWKSKELVILFCLQAIILVVLPFNSMEGGTWYYVLGLIPKTVTHFIRFIIFIIAVRHVSNYNLQYQRPADKVTSQGLPDQ
jgi:hypothetical protein